MSLPRRTPLKRTGWAKKPSETPKRVAKPARPKNVIRQLRAGDPIPEGPPRRYPTKGGYVRLRWKVGTYEYVEAYEHRLAMGLPDANVHHLDEDKHHNDPGNLEILTTAEHARRHAAEAKAAAQARRENEWDGKRSRQAFEKAERARKRRAERERFRRGLAEEYLAGATTTELAERHGMSTGNVSRALRSVGVVMRPPRNRRCTDPNSTTKQKVDARSRLCCERCGRSLVWEGRQQHHRRPRAMGGSRRETTNLPGNLIQLCVACHAWIESNRENALEQGLLVLQNVDDPATVPVLLPFHGPERVLLDNDGGHTPAPGAPSFGS